MCTEVFSRGNSQAATEPHGAINRRISSDDVVTQPMRTSPNPDNSDNWHHSLMHAVCTFLTLFNFFIFSVIIVTERKGSVLEMLYLQTFKGKNKCFALNTLVRMIFIICAIQIILRQNICYSRFIFSTSWKMRSTRERSLVLSCGTTGAAGPPSDVDENFCGTYDKMTLKTLSND